MIHLIYVSSATQMMKIEDLHFLLEQSRNRNKRQNVTGMLLYSKGSFFQVLEGEKDDIEDIYAAINKDDRNSGNFIIEKEEIKERVFPGWSMGFRDIAKIDKKELQDYSEFLDREMAPEEFCHKNNKIIELLYQFKKTSDKIVPSKCISTTNSRQQWSSTSPQAIKP